MQIIGTKSFIRDLKKLKKKHFPIDLLKPCLKAIVDQDKDVLKQIKDHALTGQWHGYREFHPSRMGNYGNTFDSWIVIYRIERNQLTLLLISTGNHGILDKK